MAFVDICLALLNFNGTEAGKLMMDQTVINPNQVRDVRIVDCMYSMYNACCSVCCMLALPLSDTSNVPTNIFLRLSYLKPTSRRSTASAQACKK